MRNRRYLKPIVEKTLWAVTLFMIMILAMLYDFELSFRGITILFGWVGIIILNLFILEKWGRGLIFENED